MSTYSRIKKEFIFLEKMYEFKITLKRKYGAYYFIKWTNTVKNIMVLYDELVDDHLSIRVYDADALSFDAEEYKDEFDKKGKQQYVIQGAAEWLKKEIEDKRITAQ